MKYCRNFLSIGKQCTREDCKFTHDDSICKFFYTKGHCKFGDSCKFTHVPQVENKNKKIKNTECFVPMTKPVDMRVVVDVGKNKLRTQLTSRDVLLVPNLFTDFAPGEIYDQLVQEIENCSIPKHELLKLWHGNETIEGTHIIANDRTNWKDESPTFNMVIERIRSYFDMDVKATRFNWYQDTSQWKPFHFDAAKVDPEKAAVQNFTIVVSFVGGI